MELHAGFNSLDYIVLGIILVSGLFALMTGLVRELYSLLNWIASYFISIHFYFLAVPFVKKYISNPNTIIDVSIFAVFCASFIILAIIGMIVTRTLISGGTLTMIDRSLGFVFGVVRGLLVVCLVYMVAASVLWPDIDKPQEKKLIEQVSNGPATEPQAKEGEKQSITMSAPHWLVEARTRPLLSHGAALLKKFIPEKAFEKTAQEVLRQKESIQNPNP